MVPLRGLRLQQGANRRLWRLVKIDTTHFMGGRIESSQGDAGRQHRPDRARHRGGDRVSPLPPRGPTRLDGGGVGGVVHRDCPLGKKTAPILSERRRRAGLGLELELSGDGLGLHPLAPIHQPLDARDAERAGRAGRGANTLTRRGTKRRPDINRVGAREPRHVFDPEIGQGALAQEQLGGEPRALAGGTVSKSRRSLARTCRRSGVSLVIEAIE